MKSRSIILCLLNFITEFIQVTEGHKYVPWEPHVGQPCCTVCTSSAEEQWSARGSSVCLAEVAVSVNGIHKNWYGTVGLPIQWHAAFTADPVFFISFARPVSLYCWTMCVYIHIWLRIDCIYVLVLLPNKNAVKQFYTSRSGVKCSLDMYHCGAGLAVTGPIHDIGQNVLQSSFQTGSIISPSYCHMFFLIAFLEEDLLEI